METQSRPLDAADALRALEQAEAVRREVAQRAVCPPHWHLAFGLLMATLIAAQAAPPLYAVGIMALWAGAFVLMLRAIRRRLGFFVNGWRRGRTLRVSIALLVYCELLLMASLWLKLSQHIGWAPLAAAALVFPGAVYGSYVWQRVYLAEMNEGPRTLAP